MFQEEHIYFQVICKDPLSLKSEKLAYKCFQNLKTHRLHDLSCMGVEYRKICRPAEKVSVLRAEKVSWLIKKVFATQA